MHTYIASERKDLLEANHLSDFDHLWACHSDWFEAPNNDRKGWSGVNHLFLQSPGGNALGVFSSASKTMYAAPFCIHSRANLLLHVNSKP